MYRKLASAVLVASAINAQYALALGLGGITMHSALNQPLDAEIAISSTEDLDKSQILISFASQDDFLKAGVDRVLFLADIKFDVILDGKGGGVVKLSSTKRLNEPYLDLLLEAKWPTGKMLRSYTVLVDLPVYAESESSSVDIGESKVPAPSATSYTEEADKIESSTSYASPSPRSSASASSHSESAKSAPSQKASATGISGFKGTDYQIKSNETLSGIAAKLKPGSQVTLNQTMLAIKKLNPHAFVRNNINLIKAGAVLRVPTESDISQISAGAASKEVADQNREWRSGAQLDATDSYRESVARPSATDEGHLSLTSAGSGSANGKDKSGAGSADAQQKLNAVKESFQVSKLENKELNTKVDSLNTQVNQLKRMIELKDAELADLQKKLGKDAVKPAPSVAASEKVEELDKEKKPEQAVELPDDTAEKIVPEEKAIQEEAVIQEAKPKKPVSKPESKKPVKPLAVQEKTLLEKIQSNALYFGVFALVLIFGVVAFLFRRKAQAERQSLQDNDISNFDFDEALGEASLDNLGTNEITEEFDPVPDVDHAEESYSLDDNETTLMQTSDPIGEADIYIAYGRYDQAAELLLNAISASPENLELRTKLLEVYVESKNKTGFQQQYLELRALGKVAAIGHAKELLTSADNVADWLDDLPVDDSVPDVNAESAFDSRDDVDDQESDFSFKEELETLEEPVEGSAFLSDASSNESGDDFDLDLSGLDDLSDTDFSVPDVNETSQGDADTTDFDADLSMDLSEFDTDSSSAEISFDLDESSTVVTNAGEDELSLDMDDLSFDLSGEIETDQTENFKDEALDESFDLGDLAFEEETLVDSAAIASNESSEEDLSFEDFDLNLDDQPEKVEAANEEIEIDFSDVDLGLEDSSSLVSSEPTILRNAIDLELGDELSLDDLSADASSFAFNEADDAVLDLDDTPVAVPEVSVAKVIEEPHVSTPIATLDSEDLEFLTDGDEVSTKLDLAQAYVDLGDIDGARDILLEVMKEGKDEQKAEAAALLDSLD